ncbi:hypothetical protein Tco_0977292 [Tanacetum coccineum]|uniref:Uncharacterized protein n=1 Tax=Tanacetum coccineum TaxID=301880 RepID=A0ABQ5EJP0_9ASTR
MSRAEIVSYHKLYEFLKRSPEEVMNNSQIQLRESGYDNQRAVNVAGARENVETKRVKDAAYHKEKGFICVHKRKAGVQLNARQRLGRMILMMSLKNELEAHYMYMAQIQEVTPDPVDNSGPIFDDEPMHKVQNNNDNYNVFAMENEHPVQLESSNDTYLVEQGDTNITIDSSDICYDRVRDARWKIDDLDQERDLPCFLIR